jgi:hypothetical protein
MVTCPIVGLIVNSALRDPGAIRDPLVSWPRDKILKPAATLTADPAEDPPGVYKYLLA